MQDNGCPRCAYLTKNVFSTQLAKGIWGRYSPPPRTTRRLSEGFRHLTCFCSSAFEKIETIIPCFFRLVNPFFEFLFTKREKIFNQRRNLSQNMHFAIINSPFPGKMMHILAGCAKAKTVKNARSNTALHKGKDRQKTRRARRTGTDGRRCSNLLRVRLRGATQLCAEF